MNRNFDKSKIINFEQKETPKKPIKMVNLIMKIENKNRMIREKKIAAPKKEHKTLIKGDAVDNLSVRWRLCLSMR